MIVQGFEEDRKVGQMLLLTFARSNLGWDQLVMKYVNHIRYNIIQEANTCRQKVAVMAEGMIVNAYPQQNRHQSLCSYHLSLMRICCHNLQHLTHYIQSCISYDIVQQRTSS